MTYVDALLVDISSVDDYARELVMDYAITTLILVFVICFFEMLIFFCALRVVFKSFYGMVPP